tara:strand:+ start:4023 stop:4487 length:465 start_codon:yes stop_codon:yes gene_type:complete
MIRELKHIAPHIAHGLTCNLMGEFDAKKDAPLVFKVTGIDQRFIEIDNGAHHYEIESEEFFPLLRPMSDLFENIVHNGEIVCVAKVIKEDAFVLHELYYDLSFKQNALILRSLGEVMDFDKLSELPFFVVEILFKYHFDVFGLIEKGLAQPLKT